MLASSLFPSIFPSISVFSRESALHIRWPKYWSLNNSPFQWIFRLISLRIDWFDYIPLLGMIKLFSKVVASFYIPTNNVEDFNCPFSSIVFICLIAEPFYSVWSGISYDLRFLNKLNIFSCAYWLFVCFFEEITIQIFCPFSNWVFLYTVDL